MNVTADGWLADSEEYGDDPVTVFEDTKLG